MNSWPFFAVLSAMFAAMTAILAKAAVTEAISSNLATAIRTAFVLLMALAIVALKGEAGGVRTISGRTWLLLWLSGMATGASWLCYFRALQLGPASRVAPVDKLSVALTLLFAFAFLGEKATFGSLAGGALITAGVLVATLMK